MSIEDLLIIPAVIFSLITLVMVFKKIETFTFLAFINEFKPNAANIILTIILFGLTFLFGFPFATFSVTPSIVGFWGQCFWGNIILDLLFWYVISCIFIFIYRPINKKDQ